MEDDTVYEGIICPCQALKVLGYNDLSEDSLKHEVTNNKYLINSIKSITSENFEN